MSEIEIKEITEKVKAHSALVQNIFSGLSQSIVGQKNMLEKLLIGLLADGHILLEGVPGLAKTTAIKALAYAIDTKFNRVQFTPDLLPADLIGTLVFFICFLLPSLEEFNLAFALGLFAIFGIIRYRTNPIPIKEMTYLFVVIGISVINGLSSGNISYPELVFTNSVTIIVVFFLERIWLQKNEFSKIINYEKIMLIQPDKRTELVKDIKQRTGLDVFRVEIGRINYLQDTVRIKVYYSDDNNTEEDGTETGSFFDNGD